MNPTDTPNPTHASAKLAFLLVLRGIPTAHTAAALTWLTPGFDWSGASKALMSDRYGAACAEQRLTSTLAQVNLGKLARLARARADGIRNWREVA